jgi:hypothetical protein
MGVVLFLCLGRQIEQQKLYKNKIRHGLRWLPFDILHATINQKNTCTMEKRWDRTHNQAVTLGESDSIVLWEIELGGDKH